MADLASGHATADGTAAYAKAHPAAKGHWRPTQGLTLSSVGMGSYLGKGDPAARQGYQAATLDCLQGGINVLDTAANYRDQASERDLGAGIRVYLDGGGSREGFLVSTKAGFLHGDCDEADPDAWFETEYLGDPPAIHKDEVRSSHTLAPSYIRHELDRSRRNLGLETIDVMFLHNPEHQLDWGVAPGSFYLQVEDAFEALERACDEGKVRMYGVATWDGLRVGPEEQGHLGLVKLVHHAGQARMRVGGKAAQHHFRALQLPVNLAMTEAYLKPTQPFKFGAQTILQAARELDMLVMASASLMQMRLKGRIPPEFTAALGGKDDAQTALQFTRSVPGVTTALVGMASRAHAESNAKFATSTPPATAAVKTLMGTGSLHGA